MTWDKRMEKRKEEADMLQYTQKKMLSQGEKTAESPPKWDTMRWIIKWYLLSRKNCDMMKPNQKAIHLTIQFVQFADLYTKPKPFLSVFVA